MFRSNCAFCHGLTARGGRGPDLRATAAQPDDAVRNTVKKGVPGTTMPAFNFEPDEVDSLVVYLRQVVQGAGSPTRPSGDAARGAKIYASQGCATCHSIAGQGSVYGPDLSRIGAGRPVEHLRESLLDPSADIAEDYEGVTAVLSSGQRIQGIRINEDTFTLQLRDPSQKFRMLGKDEVREVVNEKQSLMPAYKSLAKPDLEDVIAYLYAQRAEAGSPGVRKPEAMR